MCKQWSSSSRESDTQWQKAVPFSVNSEHLLYNNKSNQ